MKQIKSYHSAMLEQDKNLIPKAFSIAEDENPKCTITDAYGMGISNLDVRLVIQ